MVHVHGALAAILLRRALRTAPPAIPLVYTEHDSTPWSCRYRRRLERAVRRCVYRRVNLRACRAATTVVTNFPSLADELAMRAGIPRSRFTTVRNATDARWLADYRDAESVKARHGFDRYCLFVGSLVARKGPDILLHALTKVACRASSSATARCEPRSSDSLASSGSPTGWSSPEPLEHHDVHRLLLGGGGPGPAVGVRGRATRGHRGAQRRASPSWRATWTASRPSFTTARTGCWSSRETRCSLAQALSLLENDEILRALAEARRREQRPGDAEPGRTS